MSQVQTSMIKTGRVRVTKLQPIFSGEKKQNRHNYKVEVELIRDGQAYLWCHMFNIYRETRYIRGFKKNITIYTNDCFSGVESRTIRNAMKYAKERCDDTLFPCE